MEMINKLTSYFSGEVIEETEEQRQNRERRQAKLRVFSKSQRESILDELRDSIKELIRMTEEHKVSSRNAATMESTDDTKDLVLNDDLPIVTKVCNSIDKCCSHGLRKVEGEEDSFVKFFGILKWTCTRLEAINQQRMVHGLDEAGSSRFSKEACQLATSSLTPELSREVRGFIASVRTANSLANVHLDEGKSRAFIRQALNTHILLSCLQYVLSESNSDLLRSYYTEYAMFRQKDDVENFLSLLDGFDKLYFGFMVDDLRLDLSPDILPFSRPLPKPEPKFKAPEAPDLINPEDMVEGRIRLSMEDNENALLAEKLVSNRHLRMDYNATSGGNPLAEVLRRAQTSHALGDATTAVLRFLEIGLPEYDVFGAPLINVVCNPFLCGMARFDTSMGLPDVAEACICYLHRKLSTPGLFQVHLAAEHVMDLRDAIEELGGFHKSMAIDPHEVVAILMQYLWELPEPLLTEERWEAFIACGSIEDIDQRKRNLQLLVNDLPWSHKPLLERILHLFGRALQPEFSQRSGVDVSILALLLSPISLRCTRNFRFSELDEAPFRRFPVAGHTPIRNRLPPEFYGELHHHEAERAAAEAKALHLAKRQAEEGAVILRFLIKEQSSIMGEFRTELCRRRKNLKEKVVRLESIRKRLDQPIDITNSQHVSLLAKLWSHLLVCEDEDTIDIWCGPGEDDVDVQSLLRSKRWRVSGFHTEDPLGGFRGGGLLSLECLVYFLSEYPDKAKAMMSRNALPGGNRYPFPVASINVLRMLTKLVMVDAAPAVPSKLMLHSESGIDTILEMEAAERVSRTPFWKVFDDVHAFEKLHAMAFMLLDLHWTRSGATQMGFNPVLDSTRRQMGYLLELAPCSVEEMWRTWMQVREKNVSRFSTGTSINANTCESNGEELAGHVMQNLKLQEEKRLERNRYAIEIENSRRKEDTKIEDVDNNSQLNGSNIAHGKEDNPETASVASTTSASPSKEDFLDEWNSPVIMSS